MSSPGADPERLLARVTAVSVILQGLLERLVLAGTLDLADLSQIKQFAIDLTTDLQNHSATGAQVGGSRVAEEVNGFFAAMNYLQSDADRPR